MNAGFIALCFALAALLYSSAGLGGGSAYGAILGLAGFDQQVHRILAHACNLLVVGGAIILFIRRKLVPWKLALPLAGLSVPAVALSSFFLDLTQGQFRRLLGAALLLTAVALLIPRSRQEVNDRTNFSRRAPLAALLLAPGLGALAGATAIGGGIFLAPLLHLFRSAPPREIAATTTFFVLCNSLVGLGTELAGIESGLGSLKDWWILPLAVVIGGQIGSRLASGPLPEKWVRLLSLLVVSVAGVRLLWAG